MADILPSSFLQLKLLNHRSAQNLRPPQTLKTAPPRENDSKSSTQEVSTLFKFEIFENQDLSNLNSSQGDLNFEPRVFQTVHMPECVYSDGRFALKTGLGRQEFGTARSEI